MPLLFAKLAEYMTIKKKTLSPKDLQRAVLHSSRLLASERGRPLARQFLLGISRTDDYEHFERGLIKDLPIFALCPLVDYLDIVDMEELLVRGLKTKKRITEGEYEQIHKRQLDVLDVLMDVYPSDMPKELWKKLSLVRDCVEAGTGVPPIALEASLCAVRDVTIYALDQLKKRGETASYIVSYVLSGLRECMELSEATIRVSFAGAAAGAILTYGKDA